MVEDADFDDLFIDEEYVEQADEPFEGDDFPATDPDYLDDSWPDGELGDEEEEFPPLDP